MFKSATERLRELKPEFKENLKIVPSIYLEYAYWILQEYDEVTIIFENGKYNVRTGTMISSSYPDDRRYIGRFNEADILERIEEKNKTAIEFNERMDNFNGTAEEKAKLIETLGFEYFGVIDIDGIEEKFNELYDNHKLP